LAQSKIQKEKDNKDNVSFAKIVKDTVLPLKDASKLLKKLQPEMTGIDEWKSSAKRQEIIESNGYKHKFYSQYHKGVRVEGGEFGVHAKNDSIESVLGDFKSVGDVNVEAEFSEEEALQSALNYIGAEIYKWQVPEEEAWILEYYNDTYYPKSELVITKDRLTTDSVYRLAYKFDIYSLKYQE
jgi:Zn-dependent metalloprotease